MGDGIIMAKNIEFRDVIEDTMQYRFQRGRYFGYEVLIKFLKEDISDDRKAMMKRFAAIRINMRKYTDIDKNPNIVQFFGVLLEPEVGTVSEYLGGGTMEELLDNSSSANFEAAVKYCIQISSGLHFLHEHGIVHRCLNPSNIFLSEDHQTAKIGDFILQTDYADNFGIWTSPEEMVPTVHHIFESPRPWKSYADVYSFGFLLWKLLVPDIPFRDMDGLRNSSLDEDLQKLVMNCCSNNPELRPEFKSIIQFLQDY